MLAHVVALLGLAASILACPQIVLNVCRCEDLHNGVALNCSDSNAGEVVQVLKDNQAMLGLIQTLTMHRANIRKIPAGFLSGLYIKKLDLSYNQMVDVDDNAFVGMSPVLQELILHHNNLTHIPVLSLGTLKTLLKLDLSNNTITDLRAEDALPALHKLYDINLASNRICNVYKGVFENIKNSVQAINLGHNCLSAVPAAAIRGFKQLMALHMHKNKIETLDNLAFMNLPVLNLLNLASNKIGEIRPQAFLNVPNIRYLYLTDNKVTKIAAHQFAAFEQLEMLDLTGNFIEEVPQFSFSHLPQLRQLYLGSNRINNLASDAFVNSSIVILILSGNKLSALNEGELNGMPNLQQVSFKDNQIKSLHANAFYNVPSLVMIDLSQNELTDLPPASFMAQLSLLLIDLSKNKIVRTPYAAFNRRVGTVLLQENPLCCSEKVHMLQDGIGVYIPTSEDIVCGGTKKALITTTTTPVPEVTESAFKQDAKSLAIRPVLSGIHHGVAPSISHSELFASSERETPALQQKVPEAQALPGTEIIPVRPLIGDVPNKILKPASRTRFSGGGIAQIEKEVVNSNEEKEEEETETAPVDTLVRADKIPAGPTIYTTAPPAYTQPSRSYTLGARVYTDIADNPNIIHPFPVPFLKRGPTMHKAERITRPSPIQREETTVSVPTLPPSILIAPKQRLPSNTDEIEKNKINSERFEEFTMETKTNMPKEIAIDPPYELEGTTTSMFSKVFTPMTIIIVCLSTVGIVMLSVFIGLCVARHRSLQRLTSSCSDSTTARTNAYVAAQAAQMNMIYGTTGRSRSMSMSRPEDMQQQPWIYTPGPAYTNYYK